MHILKLFLIGLCLVSMPALGTLEFFSLWMNQTLLSSENKVPEESSLIQAALPLVIGGTILAGKAGKEWYLKKRNFSDVSWIAWYATPAPILRDLVLLKSNIQSVQIDQNPQNFLRKFARKHAEFFINFLQSQGGRNHRFVFCLSFLKENDAKKKTEATLFHKDSTGNGFVVHKAASKCDCTFASAENIISRYWMSAVISNLALSSHVKAHGVIKGIRKWLSGEENFELDEDALEWGNEIIPTGITFSKKTEKGMFLNIVFVNET